MLRLFMPQALELSNYLSRYSSEAEFLDLFTGSPKHPAVVLEDMVNGHPDQTKKLVILQSLKAWYHYDGQEP